MRYVGYRRVSRTEEAIHGHSMDAQGHIIVQFGDQRGWELVRIYEDPGISGTRNDRPALEQLLRDAEAGLFDVVIVHAVDRFYRDLVGLLAALNHLYKHNVSFISITENMDFTTPWGKLTLAVLGTLAEIYIDKLSAETKKGKLARARKGLYNGSPPLGYCRGNCADCTELNGQDYCPRFGGPDLHRESPSLPLHAHPVESVAVQRAFEWYLGGQYSDGDIAERLNADGLDLPGGTRAPFRTKGMPGRFEPGPFSKDAVRELLQRRFYAGFVTYYSVDAQGRKRKRQDALETFSGQHPALVSVEDFERALALRRRFGKRTRRGNSRPCTYPLSGLLLCSACKKPLRGCKSGQRRYYRDVTRINHAGDCTQPTLRAEDIETQVIEFLRSLKLRPDWRSHIVDVIVPPQEQAEIQEKERQLQARLKRAGELYLEGIIDHSELMAEKRHHQRDMADLRLPEIDAIMGAGKFLEQFPDRWENVMSAIKQNELLQRLIAGAWVKDTKLISVQFRLSFYTLMRHCLSGSDGI